MFSLFPLQLAECHSMSFYSAICLLLFGLMGSIPGWASRGVLTAAWHESSAAAAEPASDLLRHDRMHRMSEGGIAHIALDYERPDEFPDPCTHAAPDKSAPRKLRGAAVPRAGASDRRIGTIPRLEIAPHEQGGVYRS